MQDKMHKNVMLKTIGKKETPFNHIKQTDKD